MTANRTDGLETKRRLLDAAGVLFSKNGFRDTKTADICRAAKANGAAVNYHFGGKERLYVAAWRHEFERSIAAYPPDGGVPVSASPEDRLRGHIHALVGRFMDPDSRELDMTHREMSNPTGLLGEIIHSSLEPLRRMHLAIVRDLLGPRATEQHVQLCGMSIHAQCFATLMHERHRRHPQGCGKDLRPPELEIDRDVLADHIVTFSLAGIREVRRKGDKATRPRQRAATKGARR